MLPYCILTVLSTHSIPLYKLDSLARVGGNDYAAVLEQRYKMVNASVSLTNQYDVS